MQHSDWLQDEDRLCKTIVDARLFDAEAYLADNPDVAGSGIDALLHYVRYGLHEDRRRPFIGFSPQQYRVDFDVPELKGNEFLDLLLRNKYRRRGKDDDLSPIEVYAFNLILHKKVFDEQYYLAQSSDLQGLTIPPLVHYLKFGRKEHGRRCTPRYRDDAYLAQFGHDIPSGDLPILHYIRHNLHLEFIEKGLLTNFSHQALHLAASRLKGFPLYSDADYLEMNSDVRASTLSPHHHALLYGLPEGRHVLSKVRIAKVLGKSVLAAPLYQFSSSSSKSIRLPQSIGVFYHTAGNTFIKEIAEDVVAYLTDAGLSARLMNETDQVKSRPDLCIFCAPHEFFFLPGAEAWSAEEILRASVMVNTEQPQTLWFSRGMIYLLMSAGVIEFLHQNVDLFREVGIPAVHFDPIPDSGTVSIRQGDAEHAAFRVLPEEAKDGLQRNLKQSIRQRPIDVSFFGNASPKREKFFSRNADYFAGLNCYIMYRKLSGPLTMSGAGEILGRLPAYVAESSKICLNIHRDDNPYFEWHRIVKQGAARGAVVVTDDCPPTPLYKDGLHYLTESPRHMPMLISWLLKTKDGLDQAQKIQDACLALMRDKKLIKSKHNDVLRFVANVWSGVENNVR